jgi:hypothetical protein
MGSSDLSEEKKYLGQLRRFQMTDCQKEII